MLSHDERRQLAAMERQMLIEDPAFARLFTQSLKATGAARRRAAAAVIGWLCALAAITGLLAGSVLLVGYGASLAIAAGWVFRRNRHPHG